MPAQDSNNDHLLIFIPQKEFGLKMSRLIALSYHDVVLYYEDIALLQDGAWLNDTCIEFFMEYLERTELAARTKNIKDNDYGNFNTSVVKFTKKLTPFLLRPAIAFLIYSIKDPQYLSSALPPKIFTADIIIFPINDNQDPLKAGGGTHWSLVVYVRPLKKFFYYDSASNFNAGPAQATIKSIADVLNIQGYEIIPMKTPQQDNDCGVYVIAIIDHIFHQILQYSISDKTSGETVADSELERLMEFSTGDITLPKDMRRRVRAIIDSLRE
ncbi:hypothetical protein G9A89_001737 [Geosiphon pyriformis]|nr:hypothetical protein G9A89_001737 [Geosiphon pyriformis]